MNDPIEDSDAVLFRELKAGMRRIGLATLNAPASLNALNLDMVRLLDRHLRDWAADPALVCAVIDSAPGTAFCAGGDVRFLYHSMRACQQRLPNPPAEALYSEEYRLDYAIHVWPKPLLLWGSGIVMGGGPGLMMGASHRVVTESSRIAMPEVAIGTYPDVGGSWFLPRIPDRVGRFLGLTGMPVNARDALDVGLADFLLCDADHDALLARLAQSDWGDDADSNAAVLSRALGGFSERAVARTPRPTMRPYFDEINRLMEGDDLLAVVARITRCADGAPWLHAAAAGLAAASPTSTAVAWAMWQRLRHASLAEVFAAELVTSLQCCAHPDYAEGVRARLIDKDHDPHWQPPTLAEVSAQWLEQHFAAPASMWVEGANPLSQLAGS